MAELVPVDRVGKPHGLNGAFFVEGGCGRVSLPGGEAALRGTLSRRPHA